MPYGKAYKLAWTAHDAAHQALTKFAAAIDLWNGSKLSREDAETLCRLLASQDLTAERIRIIRNKPLPGVAPKKPRGPKSAGKRAQEVIDKGRALPRPSAPASSEPATTPPAVVPTETPNQADPSHPDGGELSEYPG